MRDRKNQAPIPPISWWKEALNMKFLNTHDFSFAQSFAKFQAVKNQHFFDFLNS